MITSRSWQSRRSGVIVEGRFEAGVRLGDDVVKDMIAVRDDLEVIHSIIDDIPDDRVDDHILWPSKKQGHTPYAVALKVVSEG